MFLAKLRDDNLLLSHCAKAQIRHKNPKFVLHRHLGCSVPFISNEKVFTVNAGLIKGINSLRSSSEPLLRELILLIGPAFTVNTYGCMQYLMKLAALIKSYPPNISLPLTLL